MSRKSDGIAQKIINLLDKNWTTKEIADQVGCSVNRVYNERHKYKAEQRRNAVKRFASKPTPLPEPKLVEDMVNNPPHYTKGGIEVIDFIEAKNLGYNLGNVVKYISRVDDKDNPIENLEKAMWYLKRETETRKRAAK